MRGDVHRLRVPKGTRGHEQQGERYAVIVQSDALEALSTWIVAPTSRSVRPATFRPQIEVQGSATRVLVEQASAVGPGRLGPVCGHLSHGEMRAVEAAMRLVLSL